MAKRVKHAKKSGQAGSMTVAEAGRRGGRETSRLGHEHYVKIGRMGGQRVRDLIEAGRRALERKK